MDIRCKRCFKKYDESFPLCPRCGKESVYKRSDSYNRECDTYKSNEKVKKESFVRKVIESYDRNKIDEDDRQSKDNNEYEYTGQIQDDILDKIWEYIASGFNTIFKVLIKYRHCEFCGKKNRESDFYCSECKNGFTTKSNESKVDERIIHEKSFRETAKEFISIQDGRVDFDLFLKKLENNKFDFNSWNQNGEFKTGIRTSKFISMALYTFLITIIFLSNIDKNGVSTIFYVWFFVILILGNLFAIPLTKRYLSEAITINNYYISVYNGNSRNQIEAYGCKPENIKSFELIYDSRKKLEIVIFRSKNGMNVSNPIYSLSVARYENKDMLAAYILLFACENNKSVYIKTELEDDIDEEIKEIEEIKVADKLFVRIDSKVKGKTLTDLEYSSHIAYLKNVSESSYFMGGAFENESGGMIIFSAIDLEDATEISNDDPIIRSGVYTFELMEWNIVLKSKSNYIV